MEEGDRIRLKYINEFVPRLFKVDDALAKKAIWNASQVMDCVGVKCGLGKNHKVKAKLGELETEDYLEFFSNLKKPFMEKYGCNRFWKTFKKVSLQFYISNLEKVIEYNLDLPLIDIQVLTYTIPYNRTTVYSGPIEWEDTIVTLRSIGFRIKHGRTTYNVPLNGLVSVGREIYWNFRSDSPNIVKSFDFKHSGLMKTLLVNGKPTAVADLIKITRVVDRGYHTLSRADREILSKLGDLWNVNYLYERLDRSPKEIKTSLNRLRDLGYIDGYNIITSSGLNALNR